jgi:cytochrome c1
MSNKTTTFPSAALEVMKCQAGVFSRIQKETEVKGLQMLSDYCSQCLSHTHKNLELVSKCNQ